MADNKQDLPKSLAERIKEANKAAGEKSIVSEESLVEFINKLQKDRSDNTIIEKMKRSLKKSYREKTDPYKLMKSLTPKAFTGLNKKLDSLMSQRDAELELNAIRSKKSEAEKKAIKDYLDEMVASNTQLQKIAKEQGTNAARTAALILDEQQAIQKADQDFQAISKDIAEKFVNIEQASRDEYYRRKGVQLVRIVDDKPSRKALDGIKEEMKEALELQKKQAEEAYVLKKQEARTSREEKEEKLKDRKWKTALLSLGGLLKPAKSEGGLFDFILNMLFSKGGLIVAALAGLGVALREVVNNSQIGEYIKGVVGEASTIAWTYIRDNYITPLVQKITAFWDELPLKDKILVVTAALGAFAAYIFSKLGPIVASVALSNAMFRAARNIEIAAARILAAAGGRGGPGGPVPDVPDGPDRKKPGGGTPDGGKAPTDKKPPGGPPDGKKGNRAWRRSPAGKKWLAEEAARAAAKTAVGEGGEVVAKKGLQKGLGMIAKRLAVGGAGLFIPGVGWAMTAASLGLLAYDIYDLMQGDAAEAIPEETDVSKVLNQLEIPEIDEQGNAKVQGSSAPVIVGGSSNTTNNVMVTPATNPYDFGHMGLMGINPFGVSP